MTALMKTRRDLRISRTNIARLLGVHPMTVHNWERKPETLRLKDAMRLADIYGCDVRSLIEG